MSTTLFLSGGGADSLSAAVMGMEEEFLFADLGDMPGMLTRMKRDNVPVSVTTITSQDIRRTPARNLVDLMETYVPGMLALDNSNGTLVAMRGIVTDRNYKVLMLVNGRNMNQKMVNGATTELENWDMNDIERIEIIRGPGSVTYGPGAISGVINIITKNGQTESPGLRAGATHISSYDSVGGHLSHAASWPGMSLYTYASYRHTHGGRVRSYTGNANGSGYVGKDFPTNFDTNGPSNDGHPARPFMSDPFGDPQIKIFTQAQLGKKWNLWLRYVTSRVQTAGVERLKKWTALDSKYDQFEFTQAKQATAQVEHTQPVPWGDAEVKTTLSVDSMDNEQRIGMNATARNVSRWFDHPIHLGRNFAETEFYARMMAKRSFAEKYRTALGFEYSYDYIGKGWGDPKGQLRFGDNRDIVSGPSSMYVSNGVVTDPTRVYVGRGWGMRTVSVLGEFNMELDPKMTLLLSGRVDANPYSTALYSPRIAVVSDQGDAGVFKLIAQHSTRMATAASMLKDYSLTRRKSFPEKLRGVEFIYSRPLRNEVSYSATVFYNYLDVMGWNNSRRITELVGKHKLAGTEIETKYETSRLTVGANHSFVKQIRFKRSNSTDPVTQVSYSDVGPTANAVSRGNDIYGWSNHTTKLFVNHNPTQKIHLHANSQVFWGFPGQDDGLQSKYDAPSVTATNRASIERFRAHGAHKMHFRVNASVGYDVGEALQVTLYGQGLLYNRGNRRYRHASASFHTAWTEQPRTVGVQIDYKL